MRRYFFLHTKEGKLIWLESFSSVIQDVHNLGYASETHSIYCSWFTYEFIRDDLAIKVYPTYILNLKEMEIKETTIDDIDYEVHLSSKNLDKFYRKLVKIEW